MKTTRFIAVAIACSIGVTAIADAPYDMVILNGRAMDPQSNFDGVRNVGIRDGKIVKIILDKIEGMEAIDAKDHVVVPGFIDTHVHMNC